MRIDSEEEFVELLMKVLEKSGDQKRLINSLERALQVIKTENAEDTDEDTGEDTGENAGENTGESEDKQAQNQMAATNEPQQQSVACTEQGSPEHVDGSSPESLTA